MADCYSERQRQARLAFGDPARSSLLHGRQMEIFDVELRRHGMLSNRAFILSGLFGLCTAAVAVAAAAGSTAGVLQTVRQHVTPPRLLLWATAGGANLAYIVCNCFRQERRVYDVELSRELWEIDNDFAGELQEMLAIYRAQGLTEDEALVVTRIFSKRKHLFANLMMVEELGYSRLDPPTTLEAVRYAGLPVLAGFVTGLFTPLLPLLCFTRKPTGPEAEAPLETGAAEGHAPHYAWAAAATILTSMNVCFSYVQAKIFFGAYAHAPVVLQSIVFNQGVMSFLGGLSYVAARCT